MNNKLKCLIVLSLVFLTGCTIKYDLVIDSNLAVSEKISIKENNTILNMYNKSLKSVPKDYFNQYKNIEYFKTYALEDEIHTKSETGAIVSNIFPSLEKYKKSMTIESLFDHFNITKSSNSVTVLYSGFKQSFFVQEADPNIGEMNDIEVNIKFHNNVIDSNADKYDKNNNTYTWILGKDTDAKTILFKVDTNSKRYDIIVKDFINNYLMTILIMTIIITILILFGFYMKFKTKKANKV